MRPIGIHLSYWQTRWNDDLLPLLERVRRAGFDGAEFPLLDPAALDLPRLRSELERLGLWATCGTGLNPGTDITAPDAALRQAGLAHLRLCLESAARLGSPILGGVTYAPWGVIPPDDWAGYRARCVQSLKIAGQIAADTGVTLCLEVLNRFEGYLVNNVAQGLDLLADVDRPAVKLHLDTFHQNIEEDSIADAIRLAGDQIGHFHCSENNRKRPGAGHIPWAEVHQALLDVRYSGWLVVESFLNPAGEVGRGLFIWQPLRADLDDEARLAADFLKTRVANV